MIEVIKSYTIAKCRYLSLLRFGESRKDYGYEVQFSDDDKILDNDGIYKNKVEGLKALERYKKSLIKRTQ